MAIPDPALAEVIDFRTKRRDMREREFKNELHRMGLPMRGLSLEESVLLKIEAMGWDLEHWHRKAQTARFLNGRMLEILRLANDRHAQSEKLLSDALAELDRLRKILGDA